MDTNDFERAKGALANSLAVAGPILQALQDAQQVFDVIQNASVHRAALERDVTDLLAQAEQAKSRRSDWDDMTALSMQRAMDAEAESKARCEKANNDAEETLTQLHDSLSLQIAAAQAEATDTLQGIAAKVDVERGAHASWMSEATQLRDDLQSQIDALQTKLDTLKTNAQRFADALRS